MVVAGLDISTFNIDLVMLDLDTDHAEWHRYELEGADLIERVRSAQGFRHWRPWQWEDCLGVGIERPAGRHGVAQVSMTFGAVLASLPHRLLVQPWQPAEWKKAVGLPGNASKGHIRQWTLGKRITSATYVSDGRQYYEPVPPWPEDACDAYCIAFATRQALELVDSPAESIIAPGHRPPERTR